MPDLKELLGEELYEQVKPKLSDNHVLIDKKEGEWLPKDKFNTVNDDNKELKKQLKDRDDQLKDLGEKAKGNDDLTKQIEDLKADNKKVADEYQAQLDKQAFDHTLEKSLTGAKAKNPKAVKALLDTEKIKLDGESLLGLDDQLKSLKESDSYLFETEEGGGTEPPKPSFSTGQHQKGDGKEPKSFGDALAQHFKG
jgi:hypothetical protein